MTKLASDKWASIYALSAIFFWSTVAVAFKLTLKSWTPFALLLTSSLVSFFILLLFKKRAYIFSLKQAYLGFLNPFLYYLLLFEAYDRLLAQEALILNYLWPLTLVLVNALKEKRRVDLRDSVSLLMAFIGVCFLLKGKTLENDLWGTLLALGSTIVWALYWDGTKRVKKDGGEKLAGHFFWGSIYLLATAIIIKPEFSTTYWGIVYIGAFEMGITFLLWLKAMEFASAPEKIGALVYLSPCFSLFWISMILGEKLTSNTFIAFSIIMGSLIFQKLNWKKVISCVREGYERKLKRL